MWMEITSRIVEEELESGVSKERCDDAVLTKWRRSGIPRAFSSLPVSPLAISVAAQSTKFPKVDRLNRAEK
jgi:hypothetical protein